MEVAYRLFYEKGFKATGIDEIVSQADIAKMTLYNHFRSKDELLVAVLRNKDEEWRKWFAESLRARGKSARKMLGSIFDVMEEWFNAPGFRGCPFVNSLVELADPSHPGRAVSLEHKKAVEALLKGLAAEAGMKDPARFAHEMMLVIEGSIITAMKEGGPAAARQGRDIASMLIRRG